MNSLSDSLHFVTYADFSQSTLHTNGLHSTLHDSSAFQSLHTPYPSFALLPLPPPQLHQPTVDVTKKTKKPHPPEPTRVTRPPNAFLLFNREMRKVLKDENPRMKVAEISKEIGSRWKLLGQADKAAYMAEADKLKETQRALHPNAMYIRRSKAELVKAGHYPRPKPKPKTVYVDSTLYLLPDPSQPTTAEKMTRKRQKRDKNSATPKHPLSAYMWYLTQVRPDTMKVYPGSTVGQISRLCADRWNTMTHEEQGPWKIKAQADKMRYAREMQVYAAQNEYPMGRGTRQKYRIAAMPGEGGISNSSSPTAHTSPTSSSSSSSSSSNSNSNGGSSNSNSNSNSSGNGSPTSPTSSSSRRSVGLISTTLSLTPTHPSSSSPSSPAPAPAPAPAYSLHSQSMSDLPTGIPPTTYKHS